MLIFVILCILLVISIALKVRYSEFSALGLIGLSGIILLSTGLLLVSIMLPAGYYAELSKIQQYHAVKNTLEAARQRENDFENAALQQKIIETNQWLASSQYWNEGIWDIFTPDEVMDLKPLQ